MSKLMKHPLHGFHYANNWQEEEVMRTNGWVDNVPDEVVIETKEPIPTQEKKRGRPFKQA